MVTRIALVAIRVAAQIAVEMTKRDGLHLRARVAVATACCSRPKRLFGALR
jgi:hypothetical protein